jgi:2-aminoethylphosphonate-pyruvate transaminase
MSPVDLLLTPGPVTVHPRVLKALGSAPNLHHRTSDFADVLMQADELIHDLFKIPSNYQIVFFGSSGTGAVEAMLGLAAALPKDKVLIISNGHFGDRIKQMADNLCIENVFYKHGSGISLSDEVLLRLLDQHQEIGSVFMVHMETSLGQFNNCSNLSILCEERGIVLCLDMVSSLGGEKFDFQTIRPHIAVSVSGKAIAAFPGISFMIIQENILFKINPTKYHQHYFNITEYLKAKRNRICTPFTPPIALFQPFLQALNEIGHESLDAKIRRHESCLNILVSFLENVGFSQVQVSTPSNTTRTFRYSPNDLSFFERTESIFRSLGTLIYQNQNYHRPCNLFQVSTMGWMSPEDIEVLVTEMGKQLFFVTSISAGRSDA